MVDRLLASPHYGERWGRHWLDVARYADTKGYVLFQDSNFPWSYTYRDYVVRAFNEDLPYDRFIVEQLAADKLPLGDDRRPLTALGFLTLGSGFMNNQQDVIDDRIDVVTRGLLGLTVSCARCHDHKFDPIPTRDYYSLYGVLASSVEPTVPPLFEDAARDRSYAAFAKELAEREQKLADYLDRKFAELVAGAAAAWPSTCWPATPCKDKPPTEDFMLLADPDDLNPTMIIRYQVYLERTAPAARPGVGDLACAGRASAGGVLRASGTDGRAADRGAVGRAADPSAGGRGLPGQAAQGTGRRGRGSMASCCAGRQAMATGRGPGRGVRPAGPDGFDRSRRGVAAAGALRPGHAGRWSRAARSTS